MTHTASQPGYVLDEGDGESIWFLGTLMTVKVGGAQTNNAFTLLEWSAPPGFSPPPHVHHQEDEAFYILEGEMSVNCGDQTWTATAGSFVFLPKGIQHGFTVISSGPLRGLQLTSPAGFERFISDAGEPAQSMTLPNPSAPDIPRLLRAAESIGVEIKLPTPANE